MSKSGGDTSTVSTIEPWTSQQPYLEQGFGTALGNLQTPRTFFPGPTYTPFSAQTETGIGMLEQQAMRPNVLDPWIPGQLAAGRTGTGMLERSAAGEFVGQNPWLEATYGRAAEATLPYINATFGGRGRTGSGAHAMSVGRGLADLATGIYGPAYESERQRQQAAATSLGGLGVQSAGYAPVAQQMAARGTQAMLGAGDIVDLKAREILQDQMARHQFEQAERDDALARYMNVVGGAGYGQSGATEEEIARNPLAGAIGGALAGGQLGYGLPGIIGGGLLGGLLGA